MSIKAIVVSSISLVVILMAIPSVMNLAFWGIEVVTDPSVEKIEEGIVMAVEAEIPWWVGVLEWVSKLPAIVPVAFILLLVWTGKLKN